ncbi:MAG: metal ABC transporter substrate-binding protein [Pseudomonadota bacterium]
MKPVFRVPTRRLRFIIMAALLSLFGSFLCQKTVMAETLRIVTTTPDLAAIAGKITGENAVITSLCSGKEDPHFLQAKPGFILSARNADLWIRIGMELEVGWEPPILEGARNPAIREGERGHLDASEGVIRLEVPTTRVTRAMGDVHPEGNPHYWLDPLNARIMAKTIAQRLTQLDPERAPAFRQNLSAFENALDERMFGSPLLAEISGARLWALAMRGELEGFLETRKMAEKVGGWFGKMAPLRGKKLVCQHRSWIYFTNRFGLEIVAELEPKPGIPPSAPHLREVIQTVQKEGASLILIEPFYSRKAADLVADKTGAKVLVCANSVGGQPEAIDYFALIDHLVTGIGLALETSPKAF